MRFSAIEYAVLSFRYREEVVKRRLPHDPDWEKVLREAIKPALAGEKGNTDQLQCVYQGIRLAEWQRGAVPLPWSKAFLPPVIKLPVVWYKRWWNKVSAWGQSVLKWFE